MDCPDKKHEFLTVKETAEILRVSLPVMYQLCNSKGFPAVKIGGVYRISKAAFDKWVAKSFKI